MKKPILFLSLMLLSACSKNSAGSKLPEVSVVKGVNYVGAVFTDLDKTIELYRNSVDLQQVDDSEILGNPLFDKLAGRDGVKADTRMMRSINAQVRFMSFANPSEEAKSTPHMAVQGPGIMHVCYQVNQNTEAYQKFLAGGGKHIGGREMVQLNPKNPVYYSYSRDFDGLIAEIEHVDVSKLNLPKPPMTRYRIRHVALSSPDIERLIDFYGKFLDQPSPRRARKHAYQRRKDERADKVTGLKNAVSEIAWFQVRNLELEMFQYHSHPTEDLKKPRPIDAPGYNMIVFDVSDMKAARKHFTDTGGTMVTEIEPMDGGQIMFGRDPDGNLIGMQTAPRDAVVSSQNFVDNGIR